MTAQQKDMDGKLTELVEERDHWKTEYEGLKRKMTKMKVINAITKITYANKSRDSATGANHPAAKYDTEQNSQLTNSTFSPFLSA